MKAVKGDVRAPHAGFFCELCDCFFNDEHARTMHCKGRRHRLNYKVKGVGHLLHCVASLIPETFVFCLSGNWLL